MLRRHRGLIILVVLAVLILANVFSPFRVRSVDIRLAPEVLFRIGPLPVTNTLLGSWLAMVVLIALAILSTRRLVDRPSALSIQNIVESGVELLLNFMQSIVGDRARDFFPVVATFFLYILTSNWMSLLPGFGSIGMWTGEGNARVFLPLLRSTTTDLNATLALGLCSVLSLQVYGVRLLGASGYASRFFAVRRLVTFFVSLAKGKGARPSLLIGGVLDLFVGLLEIFEDLTKVLSFSFRLFGNVFGGEVLLIVIAFLAPYVASLPFMSLELFGGFIQAVIFAVLTTAFLGRATAHHGHVVDEKEEPTATRPAGRPVPLP